MDKVVLIYPDTHNDEVNLILPLSLIYIASPLRGSFDVRIIDQRIEKNWRGVLQDELSSGRVVCAGISSMTGPQIAGGIEAASLVKAACPHVPVVWGGVHPSLLPEQTLASKLVDIVVIGDGEDTFRHLVEVLQGDGDKRCVPGIIYKDGDSVVRTIDRQPVLLPRIEDQAYDLVDVVRYESAPAFTDRPSLPIVTSRGCPHRCAYCYNTRFSAGRWTSLSAEDTVSGILDLVRRTGVSGIFLLDDNFFVNLRRVEKICESLLQHDSHIEIYNANCRADTVARMDSALLALLKRAGFNHLFIGVESGSDEVLRRISKDITVDQVLLTNEKLKKADIRPFYSFMAGFPFETTDDVKMTLQLMRRLLTENPQAFVYKLQLFTPFPGTELFHLLGDLGHAVPQSLREWADYHYDTLTYRDFPASHRQFLEQFHCYTAFLDRKLGRNRRPYVRPIASLYSRILHLRLRHEFYSLLVELGPLRFGQGIKRMLHAC